MTPILLFGAAFTLVAYFLGVTNGRKHERAKQLRQWNIEGETKLLFPHADFQSLWNFSDEMELTLRRVDRVTFEVKHCEHEKLGLGAMFVRQP